MGCSSSALNKAGDSNRLRSGDECCSTTEESKSCISQPKPCVAGSEPSSYGKVQRESCPPVQKPKASVVPTANGVTLPHEQPLARDVGPDKDATGPTEKTRPPEAQQEPEPHQPSGADGTLGAEERKDGEPATEAQPEKGNPELEPLGTEAKGQASRRAGQRDSPGAEHPEDPQMDGVMKLGAAENIPPLETVRELQPQEATGKEEQSQLLEVIPEENRFPEILEGSQFVEKGEVQKLQETLGKDEQSQLLDTIPRENKSPEVSDGSQFVQTPVMNDPLHKTPEGSGSMEQIQPEVGSSEHPAGIAETVANVEITRKIEGETGEKVKTEMENEKVSGQAETKEEEIEAVDLSAAT